jgi:hypothetical protein
MMRAGLDRLELAMLVIAAGVVYSIVTVGVTVFIVFDRGERLWFQSVAARYLKRLRPKKNAV